MATQLQHQYMLRQSLRYAYMHCCRHVIQMCEWCRVDELQQQEAAIRVAMDVASTEKHKVSLCAILLMVMYCK